MHVLSHKYIFQKAYFKDKCEFYFIRKEEVFFRKTKKYKNTKLPCEHA